MFECFLELLDSGDDSNQNIPAQFQKIVRDTLDLKNDIEFGYAVTRSQMTYNDLLGSRAYQRAINRITAEENKRIREEIQAMKNRTPTTG